MHISYYACIRRNNAHTRLLPLPPPHPPLPSVVSDHHRSNEIPSIANMHDSKTKEGTGSIAQCNTKQTAIHRLNQILYTKSNTNQFMVI